MTQPFLTADWRYLVMLNFRVDPALLLPSVPRGTVLDLWQGEAWVSLVGFRFENTRLFGVRVPGHRFFPEINLRFYVRAEETDRRGVVFLKEIVPRRAVAILARAGYNEPYVVRAMQTESPGQGTDDAGTVTYSWWHRARWNRIGATASGPAAPIRPGSDEAFIAEHYWGYTRQADGRTIEYAVEHPTWAIWPVRDAVCDLDADAEYGPAWASVLTQPASVLLADGSTVSVGRPRLLH